MTTATATKEQNAIGAFIATLCGSLDHLTIAQRDEIFRTLALGPVNSPDESLKQIADLLNIEAFRGREIVVWLIKVANQVGYDIDVCNQIGTEFHFSMCERHETAEKRRQQDDLLLGVAAARMLRELAK